MGKVDRGQWKVNPFTVTLYLLECKVCYDTLYAGKTKTSFRLQVNKCKRQHGSFRNLKQNFPQKWSYSHCVQVCQKAIADWEVTLLKCETQKQLSRTMYKAFSVYLPPMSGFFILEIILTILFIMIL